jgi:ABC-2 type transport system permease protein
MSDLASGRESRVFDLGYRRYDGSRDPSGRAVLTLALFTARRVLGLGRSGRHKVLPAITLAIAFLPALASVVFSALLDELAQDELISYGEYTFFIGSALALFASLVAPEALCPDRRSGMLGLYLAGPLDRGRYLAAKGAAVLGVMLLITVGPLLFMLVAFVVAGYGPSPSETPGLLLQIVASGVATALVYAALSLAVSSFTTRRAAAAVATVLVLFVPVAVVRSAIDSAGAPNALDLLSVPFVVADLSYRIFGETPDDGGYVTELSTGLVAAGVAATILLGAAVCWLRYRRLEAFR